MILAAHQLHYLPWLRYFDKIRRADVFVVLDDVQYNVNGWQNRNRVKGPQAEILLTVPVRRQFPQRLDEVRIADDGWRKKHRASLDQHYRRAPYFESYREPLQRFYTQPWERLNDLNFVMLAWFLDVLGIRTRILRSSALDLKGTATARLIEICRAVGATAYLTGDHATQVYLDAQAFHDEGILLSALQWSCPTYRQQYPDAGFRPDLAIVDLLFNEGPDALRILTERPSCTLNASP